MNYVIDGYNLFFWIRDDVDPLGEHREHFIITLNNALQCSGLRATIVFDGHENLAIHCPTKRQLSALEVVFPPGNLSADAFIIERLKGTQRKEREIIVTSDKHLRAQVRQLGAKIQTVKSFFKMIKRDKKRVLFEENKLQKESSDHYDRLLRSFEKKLDEEASD